MFKLTRYLMYKTKTFAELISNLSSPSFISTKQLATFRLEGKGGKGRGVRFIFKIFRLRYFQKLIGEIKAC